MPKIQMTLENILSFIKNYPAVSGFVIAGTNLMIFLAGLLFGNKLAIGRDKRKEFNDVSVPVFQKLTSQLESLKKKSYKPDLLTKEELLGVSIYLKRRKAEKFIEAVNSYMGCFESELQPIDPFRDKGSQWVKIVKDLELLNDATKRLMPFCKPK